MKTKHMAATTGATIIAGSVFYYYLSGRNKAKDVKRERPGKPLR